MVVEVAANEPSRRARLKERIRSEIGQGRVALIFTARLDPVPGAWHEATDFFHSMQRHLDTWPDTVNARVEMVPIPQPFESDAPKPLTWFERMALDEICGDWENPEAIARAIQEQLINRLAEGETLFD